MSFPTNNPLAGLSNLGLGAPGVAGSGIVDDSLASGGGVDYEALAAEAKQELADAVAAVGAPGPTPEGDTRTTIQSILAAILTGGVGIEASEAAVGAAREGGQRRAAARDAEAAAEHADRIKRAQQVIDQRMELSKSLKMIMQAQPDELKKNALISELTFPFAPEGINLFAQPQEGASEANKARGDYWHDVIKSNDLQDPQAVRNAHNELAKARGLAHKFGRTDFVDPAGGLSSNWIGENVIDPAPAIEKLLNGERLSVDDVDVKADALKISLPQKQALAMAHLAEIIEQTGLPRQEAMLKLGEEDQLLLDAMGKSEVFRGVLSQEDQVRIALSLRGKDDKLASGRWGDPTYFQEQYENALSKVIENKQKVADRLFMKNLREETQRLMDEKNLSEVEAEKIAIQTVYAEWQGQGANLSRLSQEQLNRIDRLRGQ